MYGKKRIAFSNRQAAHTGYKMVFLTGGRSHAAIGVWYERDGKFFADLRSADQRYQSLSSRDLAIKGFGGLPTKKALREAIAKEFLK